jgi:hypothetical protein
VITHSPYVLRSETPRRGAYFIFNRDNINIGYAGERGSQSLESQSTLLGGSLSVDAFGYAMAV